MTTKAEIIIVGAGPTGLTLACQLAHRGVPCRVIDQAPGPTDLSRAIGLSPRSLEIFHELGAAEDAVDRGRIVPSVNIHSHGRRIGRVATSSKTGTRYPFLLTLPQSETERLLQALLLRLGGTVERGVRLCGLHQERHQDSVSLILEGPDGKETIEAQWVIGADGAHSAVRKLAGIKFSGEATDVVFAIVDAHLEGGRSEREGHYYFSPEGLLVLVPLPDGAYRLAATIGVAEENDSVLELDRIQTLLERRVGDRSVRVRELRNAGWGSAQVQIHTRIAERFRAGRCLLAGDAAHIYSPVGGQGMNSGIQDAHNLAWKLALLSTGQGLETLLDSYEFERHSVAQTVLRATKAQTRLVTIRSRLGVSMRDALVRSTSALGVLDRRMAPQLAQLDISYRRSPAIASNGRRGSQGKRIPDLPVDPQFETLRTLFDLLAENTFTALVFSPELGDFATIGELADSMSRRYGDLVTVLTVWSGRAAPPSIEGPLIDRGGELHKRLRIREPSLCLVRPDAHIAYQGPLRATSALLSHLDQTLATMGRGSQSVSVAGPPWHKP